MKRKNKKKNARIRFRLDVKKCQVCPFQYIRKQLKFNDSSDFSLAETFCPAFFYIII